MGNEGNGGGGRGREIRWTTQEEGGGTGNGEHLRSHDMLAGSFLEMIAVGEARASGGMRDGRRSRCFSQTHVEVGCKRKLQRPSSIICPASLHRPKPTDGGRRRRHGSFRKSPEILDASHPPYPHQPIQKQIPRRVALIREAFLGCGRVRPLVGWSVGWQS